MYEYETQYLFSPLKPPFILSQGCAQTIEQVCFYQKKKKKGRIRISAF